MNILIFPETRRFMSSHQGFKLTALNNQELTFWWWLDKSTGWWMGSGMFHNSHSGDLGNQTSYLPGCSWASLLLFPDPVTLLLDVAGEYCQVCPSLSALPLSIQTIIILFQQSFSKPAHCCSILRLLCPSVWWHYISVFLNLRCGHTDPPLWNGLRLQRPVLPRTPRGSSSGLWRCLPFLWTSSRSSPAEFIGLSLINFLLS